MDKVNQAIDNLISKVADQFINPLIALLFAVALIYFLWGVYKFVRNVDSPTGRETGWKHIGWGLLGMAIMAGAFAIVHLIQTTVQSF